MSRVVLVTGVSDDFAARCARSLAALPGTTVIGVDLVRPRRPIDTVTFVRSDLRSPVLAGLIRGRQVDTVVHLAHLVATRSRRTSKELTVIATMQLLAACERAPGLRSLVVPSSAMVYGSSFRDPALFVEDRALRGGVTGRSELGQDCLEVESYARSLGQRRDDVTVTVLRLAALIGAGVDSDLTRYLTGPVVPRVAGFDARMQFLHPADAARAVLTAVQAGRSGVFNIGAEDVVMLSQLLGWLGRPSLPLPSPLARVLGRASARTGLDLPDDLAGVTWGRVMDVSRARDELGFRAHWSSRSAAEELVAMTRPGLLHGALAERLLDGRWAGAVPDRLAERVGGRHG